MAVRTTVRNRLIAGVAVVVPVVVTGWVVVALTNTIVGLVSPLRLAFRRLGVTDGTVVIGLQFTSLLVIVLVIFGIGTVVQRRLGKRAVDSVDDTLQRIPGLGSIYQTARRMSDLLLADENDGAGQFREVKLVEFPADNTYTLAFLTSIDPPSGVVESARRIEGVDAGEYRTVFLPMAPNPVMGGHLTHVPAENVYDVDVSVEQAIQYILTTGLVDSPDSRSSASGRGDT
jgi:uncharacterized membrane protein